MFNDITMNIISNNSLERHNQEDVYFFTKIDKITIFICTGFTSRLLLKKSNIRVSRCSRYTFPYKKKRYQTLFDPHIKNRHFKWWYEWKGRPLVGLLWKFLQEAYKYDFIIIAFFHSWRELVNHFLITTRFHW